MDRRQRSEEDYRQKFEAFGLSERFDFIGRNWGLDHGRKVFVRCKTCGHEFLTYGPLMVFKARQDHIFCPKCGAASDGANIWVRSSECNEAMTFYAEGHSVKETAEKFGVTQVQINNAVKIRGITNGKDWRGARIERQKANAEKRIAERLNSAGFEYIGGYSGKDGKVTIRCQKCGAEFERTYTFARDGNVICCPECRKREAEERNEEKKRITKQQAEVRRIEREWYRLMRPPLDPYESVHRAFLDRIGICGVCGKPYTVREYVESRGGGYARDAGVCSAECKAIKTKAAIKTSHRGRRDSHRYRAKKYGCEYDSTVTLKKLIMRDGLQCKICGEMCDLYDHSWTEYAGPKYPSIDHIIPMSKGGGHIWSNVQVAHIICNSNKGNKGTG